MINVLKASTVAGRRANITHTLGIRYSFTMAEILISLTIIGIIAALTLPALMANLNEKVWNTQRKALHSRLAQALAAMPRLDGYNETEEGSAGYNFIQDGVSAVLNITKVCEEDKMDKCDFDWPQNSLNDDIFSNGYKVASFITVNGESVGVDYRPSCTGSSNADFLTANMVQRMICAYFIYDLNGVSKGPNKMGKDTGVIFAYFPEYPVVVAPMVMAASEDAIKPEAVEELLAANPDFRLPTPAEAVALSSTGELIGRDYSGSRTGIMVWTDNDIGCNLKTCSKVDNAELFLVSKNGDAPRTFKTLKSEKSSAGCSESDVWLCRAPQIKTCVDGKWTCVDP